MMKPQVVPCLAQISWAKRITYSKRASGQLLGARTLLRGRCRFARSALRLQRCGWEGEGGGQQDSEGVLECLEALDFCLLIFYYHVSNLTQNINFVGREKHIFNSIQKFADVFKRQIKKILYYGLLQNPLSSRRTCQNLHQSQLHPARENASSAVAPSPLVGMN